MQPLNYYQPKSLADASAYILAHRGLKRHRRRDGAHYSLKQNNLPTNPTTLVDLNAIAGLDTIACQEAS